MDTRLTDDIIVDVSSGNVGQLTEIEEDATTQCVFLHTDCQEDEDSIYLTRSDLFKLLGVLEEANE